MAALVHEAETSGGAAAADGRGEWDLEAGLRLATGLGDRAAEADFQRDSPYRASATGWRRLWPGPRPAWPQVRPLRRKRPLALDGLKNVLSYLGEATGCGRSWRTGSAAA